MIVAALFAAPSAQAAVDWKPCEEARTIECATIPVPLDHANPGGPDLRLDVQRLRSTPGGPTQQAATAVLVGGPGGAASPTSFLESPTDPGADLLIIALRGTGMSGALQCGRPVADPVVFVRGCWERTGGQPGAYTSAAVVADLELVRAATGYPKLNLFATSYGTKVAYDYAAAYPQSVGTLVLDSPVLPEGLDPWMSSSLRAVPRVLDALCTGNRCRRITTSARADLTRLLPQARKGLRALVTAPNGRRQRITVTENDLFSLVLESDADLTLRLALPAALAAARRGDADLLGRLVGASRAAAELSMPPEFFSAGAYFATLCEETSFPWNVSDSVAQRQAAVKAAIAQRDASSWGPFSPAIAEQLPISTCIGWPTAGQREVPVRAPLAGTRTLLLSGDLDVRTPLEDAAALAGRIPGASLVRVAGAGHDVFGNTNETRGRNCGQRRWAYWLRNRSFGATCSDYGKTSTLMPRPPRSLNAVPAARGTRGRIGRTITAADATIGDAFALLPFALNNRDLKLGGLRGGSLELTESALVLRDYEYVPGVRVSGKLPMKPRRATLKISGKAAARGTVTVDRNFAVAGGRLGGRRF